MRRRAQTLLPRLCRGLRTSSAAGDSSAQGPAAFPSWLGAGASTRVSTPLTKALPGTNQRNGYAIPLQPPPTEVTTLPNGVRIVSEASTVGAAARAAHSLRLPLLLRLLHLSQHRSAASLSLHLSQQGPISSLGIYVNSGSIYETPDTTGLWPWRSNRFCRFRSALAPAAAAAGPNTITRWRSPPLTPCCKRQNPNRRVRDPGVSGVQVHQAQGLEQDHDRGEEAAGYAHPRLPPLP
jgi:hypothetical protein